MTDQGYMLLQNLTKARTEDWTEDVINLPHAGRPFKLEFEGIRGDSYEGDIALDDIEVIFKSLFQDAIFRVPDLWMFSLDYL